MAWSWGHLRRLCSFLLQLAFVLHAEADLHRISYSPYTELPSFCADAATVTANVALLGGLTDRLRLYSANCAANVLQAASAQKPPLLIMLGVWISGDGEANEQVGSCQSRVHVR
jgi:exo-beta-1,3-glucanase (GH17 family)